VWAQGLSFSGWDYCARILTLGPNPFYLIGMKNGPLFAIGEVLGANQPPEITSIGVSTLPFPTQIADPVEPDS